MKVREHGTRAKYVIDKCRCIPCTVASRDDQRRRRQRAAGIWKIHYARTRAVYVVRNCQTGEIAFRGDKAEACARRDDLNSFVRDPLWASEELVDETREHIAHLRSVGIGYRQVGSISGVGRTRVQEIARGIHNRSDRPTKRRLKWSTAERILAVTVAQAAPGAYVPAGETWRLIDEMLAAGATKSRIARGLGATTPALQLGRRRIRRQKVEAVKALHDAFYIGSPRMRAACRCVEWRDDEAERKRLEKVRSRERLREAVGA